MDKEKTTAKELEQKDLESVAGGRVSDQLLLYAEKEALLKKDEAEDLRRRLLLDNETDQKKFLPDDPLPLR